MIYVNGDSWSMSFDIDQPTIWPNHSKHIKCWPNILMSKLNTDLLNEGMGCGSNSRIEDCLEDLYLLGEKPEVIVLALTSHVRWHLPAKHRAHWCFNPGGNFLSSTGQSDDILYKWFYANGFDQLDSIYRHYKIIERLTDLCSKIGSQYVIFNMWDNEIYNLNLLENDSKIENFVLQYYDNVYDVRAQKYIKSLQNLSRLKKHWNYIEKPLANLLTHPTHYNGTDHPNSIGHEIIADYIFNYIKSNNLL